MSTKGSENILRIPLKFGTITTTYQPAAAVCKLNKGTYHMTWNSAIIGTNMTNIMYFITADSSYGLGVWVELMGLNKYLVGPAQQTLPYIVSISNTVIITQDNTPIFPYISPFSGAVSGYQTCTGVQYDQMNYLNILKVGP